MSKAQRVAANEAIHALRTRPDDFLEANAGARTLTDTKSGIEYWIDNLFCFYGAYRPHALAFGWWHGWRFSRAVNRWRAGRVVAANIAAER